MPISLRYYYKSIDGIQYLLSHASVRSVGSVSHRNITFKIEDKNDRDISRTPFDNSRAEKYPLHS